MLRKILFFGCFFYVFQTVIAQVPVSGTSLFEQLGTELPTPNVYRTASGAPGKDYFQNIADYKIKAELDDANQRITGSEIVKYSNQSPDALTYLWLQLDQNIFEKNSINSLSKNSIISPEMTAEDLAALNAPEAVRRAVVSDKQYGYEIKTVEDLNGNKLPYVINGTMMRIDLSTPLLPGQTTSFRIEWVYNITPYYGRSGYEFFEKDGNSNYFIAHWFPRLCVYDDVNGWQNKQFLGRGEFTLPFGDYQVELTVPSDHIVAATGECQNYSKVLSATQMKRFNQAANSNMPVIIANQEEAEERIKAKSGKKQTWVYIAKNVRDFAFASSRRFIWDAMKTDVYNNGRKIWSMSFYSKEGNPLWGKYSTKVVAHTLKSYGNRTIEYPYPVAISCHSTRYGGMEYPMISFNGGRPEADGTYSEQVKYGMISVIIHEVGHNFFPMIINSDERQWTWMDEGLNTFCQFLAEKEFDKDYPSRRGESQNIISYMKMDKSQQVPVMTSSDNVLEFGNNAYAKPATGLNILRETVMGRELFDKAFKEYARRWAFKGPMPADFFRTMEDASAVDLDWFWRGWFYTTDAVDQELADVSYFTPGAVNPVQLKSEAKAVYEERKKTISTIRNEKDILVSAVESDSTLRDFYNSYDRFKSHESDKKLYEEYVKGLSSSEKELLDKPLNYYQLKIKNKGGLIMPVIVEAIFDDGASQVFNFPAEIWRYNDKEIQRTIETTKKVKQFRLDPYYQLPDIDTSNNTFPRSAEQPSRFELQKQKQSPKSLNPMQESRQSNGAQIQTSN